MNFLDKVEVGLGENTSMTDDDRAKAHEKFIDMFVGEFNKHVVDKAQVLMKQYVNEGYEEDDVAGVFSNMYFGCLCMTLADFTMRREIPVDDIVDIVNTFHRRMIMSSTDAQVH